METDLAVQVITEARSMGIEVPESGGLIDVAQDIIEDARAAWESGMRGDKVATILKIVENGTPPKTRMDVMYEQKEQAIARIKKERLPIPDPIEGDDVVLPRDISVLSDAALRQLHSEFHACLSRANWLVAVDEADELAAKMIAEYHHAKAVKRAAQEPDPVTGKAKTVATLEAEAAGDEQVQEWRKRQSHHHVEVKLLKALRDTYQQSCERISREYTMRSGERDSR